MERTSTRSPPPAFREISSEHIRPLFRHVPPLRFEDSDRHRASSPSSDSSLDDNIHPNSSASAPRADHHSRVSSRLSPPVEPVRAGSHSSRTREHVSRPVYERRSISLQETAQRGPSRERERVRISEKVIERPPPPPPPARPRRRLRGASRERDSSPGSMSSDSSSAYEEPGRGYHAQYDSRYPPGHMPYGAPPGGYYDPRVALMPRRPPPDPYGGYGGYPPEYYPPDEYRRRQPRRDGYYEREVVPYFYPAPAAAPALSPAAPPAPVESAEYRMLQDKFRQLEEAQIRATEAQRAAERASEREAKIRSEAELEALKRYKAELEADKLRKEEISLAAKAAKEKAELEAADKAAKSKAEAEKKAAEEKKKFDELEAKKKALEEEMKTMKGDPDSKKDPLRIKDAVLERKFDFPWTHGKSWSSTHKLLEQAFEMWPELAIRIRESRFELIGPDKQIILPSVWETTVKPGWEVTVLMQNEHHHTLHHRGHHGHAAEFMVEERSSSRHRHKDKKGNPMLVRKRSKHKKAEPVIVSAPEVGMPMAPQFIHGGDPMFGPPPPIDGLAALDLEELPEGVVGVVKKSRSRKKGSSSGGGFLFGTGKKRK